MRLAEKERLERIENKINHLFSLYRKLLCQVEGNHFYWFDGESDATESIGTYFMVFKCKNCGHQLYFDINEDLPEKFRLILEKKGLDYQKMNTKKVL